MAPCVSKNVFDSRWFNASVSKISMVFLRGFAGQFEFAQYRHPSMTTPLLRCWIPDSAGASQRTRRFADCLSYRAIVWFEIAKNEDLSTATAWCDSATPIRRSGSAEFSAAERSVCKIDQTSARRIVRVLFIGKTVLLIELGRTAKSSDRNLVLGLPCMNGKIGRTTRCNTTTTARRRTCA